MINQDFNTMAIQAAKRARANGLTQSHISLALNVSQSQVSRVLSGLSKRHTKLMDEICIYVNNYMHKTSPSLVLENPEITKAIEEVWDGTFDHAHAIAEVIRSLSAFTKVSNLTSGEHVYKDDPK